MFSVWYAGHAGTETRACPGNRQTMRHVAHILFRNLHTHGDSKVFKWKLPNLTMGVLVKEHFPLKYTQLEMLEKSVW